MARDERNVVNLDALIPRADLFGDHAPAIADDRTIRIADLEPCSTYDQLRKPDFQRETANWTPAQVASLVHTFANLDIIPSLVLWQNGPHIFVIDGAHRLSALIAWVRDDYGGGTISRDRFGGAIPGQQMAMHQEVQRLVKDGPGTWANFKARFPQFNMKGLDVQWIRDKTPQQAADAFIRINQGGTAIDRLEVRILRAPKAALSVATRAITRGGSGNEYWKHFRSDEAKADVHALGKEIHDLLFQPPLKTPIKTMDLPLAGAEYGMGVVRLCFDLVTLANGLKVAGSSSGSVTREAFPADETGSDTRLYLKRVRREIWRVLSNEPSSFGLHPGLYFYSSAGAFQPVALLNMIAWLRELEKRNALAKFRKARGRFEALVMAHPVIMKPPLHLLGTGGRSRPKMLKLFDDVLEAVAASDDLDAVWRSLGEDYKRLIGDEIEEADTVEAGAPGGTFKTETKSAVSLLELSSVPKCPLCGGLLHPNGKVMDHRDKKEHGGWSGVKDGRWVHPVCNSEREMDERDASAAAV
ncbi:DUF262 domain-containing protein [Mesorhizobium sp. M0843]|uniref:GmrSD restriction endonuclease domain-containing protein n=1 Tax=Mesorhizobium sp. M0843 TaxID=2957010 RepID=UPI00333ACFC0